MAYVYLADINPPAPSAPPAPVTDADKAAAADALDAKAKAVDATAAVMLPGKQADDMKAHAEMLRDRARDVRNEIEGLSFWSKVAIGAAIVGTGLGVCWISRNCSR